MDLWTDACSFQWMCSDLETRICGWLRYLIFRNMRRFQSDMVHFTQLTLHMFVCVCVCVSEPVWGGNSGWCVSESTLVLVYECEAHLLHNQCNDVCVCGIDYIAGVGAVRE